MRRTPPAARSTTVGSTNSARVQARVHATIRGSRLAEWVDIAPACQPSRSDASSAPITRRAAAARGRPWYGATMLESMRKRFEEVLRAGLRFDAPFAGMELVAVEEGHVKLRLAVEERVQNLN